MADLTYREAIDRVLKESHVDAARVLETLVGVLLARHRTCLRAEEGLTLERPAVNPLDVLRGFLIEVINGSDKAADVLDEEETEASLSDDEYFRALLAGNQAETLGVLYEILDSCEEVDEVSQEQEALDARDRSEDAARADAPYPPRGLRLAE